MKASGEIRNEFRYFRADNLCRSFGGVRAVNNFSAELDKGEIVGLIGPNGAGKTTVFNLITGMDVTDSGTIYFDRNYITGRPAHAIARSGIARTFQNIRLIEDLSVLDNIKIAYHCHIKYNILHAAFRLPNFFAAERQISDRSMEFLRLFGMENLANEPAGSLPYGKRRKLEIARALATEATLILLDEPAAGMNDGETLELSGLIRQIRDDFKVTIFLIEHDMNFVMNLCERIIVLNFGEIIACGPPEQIKRDPAVVDAYLGVERAGPGEK